MAASTQSIKSVHRFLGKLKIPEARIKKVKSMNVIARTKTLILSKAAKQNPTDKDYHHNLLLELVRESGRKNFMIVFIRPNNDNDEKGDGKPYVMKSNMLGDDNWSTDEDTDDDATVYGSDNNDGYNTHDEDDENADEDTDENADEDADENAADQADNEDSDEDDDQVSEDLAYFTADESIDSDD